MIIVLTLTDCPGISGQGLGGMTALPVFVFACARRCTVQSVTRESQAACESREKLIAELKKTSDQSTDSLRNEWEKKVRGGGGGERVGMSCSPEPGEGRVMCQADSAGSSRALLYSLEKNLYLFCHAMLNLMWGFFALKNECSLH